MTISQSELIERRRQTVYELYWKGLSTKEIAKQLGDVSYRTVALDIEYLRKRAETSMLEQKRYLALEHQEACELYRYVLKKALEQFDKADKDGNEDRKERLYPIIETINGNLVATRSTGDIIEIEVRENKERADKLRKEMKIVTATTRATGTAKVTNDQTSGQSD